MAIFNFFKKKNFSSNFSVNHFDEVSITLIFLKTMLTADGIETESEKDMFQKYLLNCGFDKPEQVEESIERATFLSNNESEFQKIISNLSDTQKLTIITELVQIMGVDGEISDEEVDYLFNVSSRINILDSKVNTILDAMKRSLKTANESLKNKKTHLKSQIKIFEQKLSIQRSSDETAEALGEYVFSPNLETMYICKIDAEESVSRRFANDLHYFKVDYNYWYGMVIRRTSLPISDDGDNVDRNTIKGFREKSEKNNAEIRMINGHYEEYHFRMKEHENEDKAKFIYMRVKAFAFIYYNIKEFDTDNFSIEELSEYDNLLFHAKTSFYGAVKFIIMDMKSGKRLLESNHIKFDKNLINQESAPNPMDEKLKDESKKLFSNAFRKSINSFLSDNAKDIIKDKKNTRYKAIQDNINSIFPLSDDKAVTDIVDIHSWKYYKTLSQSQIDYFGISIGSLILTSKAFQFNDYYQFLIDFYKQTKLEIPDIIKDEIQENIPKENNDTSDIDDIVYQLGKEDNPNRSLFLWAHDLNSGKKGEKISEADIEKIIEDELLIKEKLPKVLADLGLNEENTEIIYMGYVVFIKIDIDYLATILNETENNKFYGWEDVEQYHAIYTLVSNYIKKKYVPSI